MFLKVVNKILRYFSSSLKGEEEKEKEKRKGRVKANGSGSGRVIMLASK